MLLTLFDSNGQVKATFSPNDSSTQDKEIQGDNLLKLSFTLYECITIDVNDYLDYDGERYWATEKYTPAQKSTIEWEYSFQLRGIESLITRFLVLNNTDGENEAVFALTARPIDHMRLIVKNINAGMDGLQNFKVGIVEGTDNVVIDYTGKYCQEALKELADAVHTEWWFDGQTLNLCRCEHGEEVTLGYDNGLTSLDRDLADNVKFYTRLFPIGSSRNIDPEKYHHSRLMLPGGAKYVDVNVEKYGIIHHYEQTAFADIYPRRTGTINEVRHEEVKDKDGKPFTIYYFKDKDLPFNPNDYEIGGLVKRVSFQEGSELAGLGTDTEHYFEVNYHTDTKEFEIITIWPYNDGTQLPGGTLVPKVGDKYILWNLRMPDEYYGIAEQEFLAAVEKYNKEHALDVSRYKAPTDHVWIEDTSTELFIGRRVRLESNEYFPDTGYRKSRITAISRQVNLPSKMDLEISDALSTGTMQKVEDNIKDVKNYTGALVGALNVPDIIQSGDTTKPADTNIYSARRSHKEFLSKKEEDVVQQLITFLKGIGIGLNNEHGIDKDGVARLSKLLIGEFVKDSSGAAIYADDEGNYHVEGDYVHVRKKLTAEEVEIMQTSHIKGKVVNSADGFIISDIERIGYAWRCYFRQQDAEGRRVYNSMRVNDLALCETFNLIDSNGKTANRYWHRRVVATGTNYVDIADNTYADNYASGSDAPQVGDEVVQLGNTTDKDRQSAIIQSAAGTGSPYFKIIRGIDSFTLPQPIFLFDSERFEIRVENPQRKGEYVSLQDYLQSMQGRIQAVQDQADKQLVIWFGDKVPKLTNEPANDWTDDATRKMHLHDIYYNRSYAQTGGGRAYSFENGVFGIYYWKEITDADVLKSLEAAQRAQDTADGKRRVFVGKVPIPPYDKGDQWANATYGEQYKNDLLVCIQPRGKNAEFFDIADWVPAQQYTTKQFEASLNIGGKRIDGVIKDLTSGLERVGFHLDGENSTFDVVADRFRVMTTTGSVAFFTSEGKLNTDLLDAKQIVTNGLQAGDIDAKNARIVNLTVDGNSVFNGELIGANGTFTALNCIDNNGEVVGGIRFSSEGQMAFEGDIYSQGGKNVNGRVRSSRFYASDMWCRGQFGHYAKVCAEVKNDIMYVHHGGHEDTAGVKIKLPTKTLSNGQTVYIIPLFSPGFVGGFGNNGTVLDYDNAQLAALEPSKRNAAQEKELPNGASIDVVVINSTSGYFYAFSGKGVGKQWTVINGSASQSIFIIEQSGWRKVGASSLTHYVYVPSKWLNTGVAADDIGEGVLSQL